MDHYKNLTDRVENAFEFFIYRRDFRCLLEKFFKTLKFQLLIDRKFLDHRQISFFIVRKVIREPSDKKLLKIVFMGQSDDPRVFRKLGFVIKVHFLAKMIKKISLTVVIFNLNPIQLNFGPEMILHIVSVNVQRVVLNLQVSFAPLLFIFEFYLIVTVFMLLSGKRF